jgi:hypothetical protein
LQIVKTKNKRGRRILSKGRPPEFVSFRRWATWQGSGGDANIGQTLRARPDWCYCTTAADSSHYWHELAAKPHQSNRGDDAQAAAMRLDPAVGQA